LKAHHSPQIGYLDGYRFQLAIVSGCKQIIAHEKELNKLNVFPIPDRDTGSNLKKTLMPLVTKFPTPEKKINFISQEIAELAEQSALGYSGILFSQILVGFAEALENHLSIRPDDLEKVVACAVHMAYKSVEKPVEGTILSVLRAWSEEVTRICTQTGDFVPILESSYQKAVAALKKTPDQLEVLRKNNVVDAGGKAFVYFLEGILDFVNTGEWVRTASDSIPAQETTAKDRTMAPFCVECCIRAQKLNRKDLIKKLRAIGQDLIFFGAQNFAKFHLNTPNPEEAFSCASLFGEISSKKIYAVSCGPSDQKKLPFCLVADSTCDLVDDLIEKNPIYFVPVKVQARDTIYTDRWDLIPEEFYRILDTSLSLPKTSQPSLNDFTRSYRHLLLHYESIISVHLSKALSGTFQTAVQASQSVSPEKISVLDGKNVSVGLGLVLLEGIKALEQDKTCEEAVRQIKKAARNTQIFIGLPTLKYLVMGGRITKTKGIVANLLNINPILSINTEGKLAPVSKARGEKNLEKQIFRLVNQEKQKTTGSLSIAVAHTNAPDIAERISQKIREDLRQEPVFVMNASPVLGAHAGSGAYGIAIRNHSFEVSDETLND
jgi:DegV family protein with EDD domain